MKRRGKAAPFKAINSNQRNMSLADVVDNNAHVLKAVVRNINMLKRVGFWALIWMLVVTVWILKEAF